MLNVPLCMNFLVTAPLFVRWEPSHIAAVALTLAIPLALAWWTRGDRSGQARRISEGLFIVILGGGVVWRPFWQHSQGALPPLAEMMPLHLCDWALVACVLACITHKRLAMECAYFWGLAGTLHGLITPDLRLGFPSPAYFLFFLGHGGIVGTVIYLIASGLFRPERMSAVRAFVGLLFYGAIAAAFNAAAGTNYGYTCAKPGVSSLLDFLGPWPWYLAALLVAAATSFTLLYLPWEVADRSRRQSSSRPQ